MCWALVCFCCCYTFLVYIQLTPTIVDSIYLTIVFPVFIYQQECGDCYDVRIVIVHYLCSARITIVRIMQGLLLYISCALASMLGQEV